jgi:hypothetical protein
MSKSDDRAFLESLMAQFKGETKHVPMKVKRPRKAPAVKRKTRGVGEEELTVQKDNPLDPPFENVEIDRGSEHAHASDNPADLVHRSPWRGFDSLDPRSRAYTEMMIEADDDDYHFGETERRFQSSQERESETRFRAAAKTGAHCGECGKPFAPLEPIWRERRRYDGSEVEVTYRSGMPPIYVTEDIVAPVCEKCWDRQSKVVISEPCPGCARQVHIGPKALKSWLAQGQRTYCCEDCSKRVGTARPCKVCGTVFAGKRADAAFCSPACRQRASREKKSEGVP